MSLNTTCTIKVPLHNTSTRTDYSGYAYFKLHHNKLEYCEQSCYVTEDLSLGISVNRQCNTHVYFRKDCVCSVERYFHNGEQLWVVGLTIKEAGDEQPAYYIDSEEEANRVLAIFHDWLFEDIIPYNS